MAKLPQGGHSTFSGAAVNVLDLRGKKYICQIHTVQYICLCSFVNALHEKEKYFCRVEGHKNQEQHSRVVYVSLHVPYSQGLIQSTRQLLTEGRTLVLCFS